MRQLIKSTSLDRLLDLSKKERMMLLSYQLKGILNPPEDDWPKVRLNDTELKIDFRSLVEEMMHLMVTSRQ